MRRAGSINPLIPVRPRSDDVTTPEGVKDR